MSRIINFVYGALIILVALDALFIGIIPDGFLSYAVIALGALVLLTPVASPPYGNPLAGTPMPRGIFQFLRRWVFGAAMVLMGVASAFGSIGEKLPFFTIYSAAGPFILLGIGAIYFLSAFARTRRIMIGSY